jgi:hypothetical protein
LKVTLLREKEGRKVDFTRRRKGAKKKKERFTRRRGEVCGIALAIPRKAGIEDEQSSIPLILEGSGTPAFAGVTEEKVLRAFAPWREMPFRLRVSA